MDERRASLAALEGVDDRMVVHPESGWRVQDLIGHLAAWEREALAALQCLTEGDRYDCVADRQRFNEEHHARRRDFDPAQLRMDWGMARRELLFVLREVPEEKLDAPLPLPWGGEGTVSEVVEGLIWHEAHHLAQIGARRRERG